jgi:hypothetical protein
MVAEGSGDLVADDVAHGTAPKGAQPGQDADPDGVQAFARTFDHSRQGKRNSADRLHGDLGVMQRSRKGVCHESRASRLILDSTLAAGLHRTSTGAAKLRVTALENGRS